MKTTNSKTKSKKGFTLIEVVVALLLIGLLTISVLPWFGKSFEKLNQASTMVKSDYTAQEIIAQTRIDPNYNVPKDSGLELTREIKHYVVDGTTIYYEGEDGYTKAVEEKKLKPEKGMKIDIKRASDGSMFLSTFVRSKALSIPVKVLDTTQTSTGVGIKGVEIGLYKRVKSGSTLLGHNLIATQTTNESGNAFFILPSDYESEEYVVMFPSKQYKAYYRYGNHKDTDGNNGSYKIKYRDDIGADEEALLKPQTKAYNYTEIMREEGLALYKDSTGSETTSVNFHNLDARSGDIVCEILEIGDDHYIFDSDTLIGATGNERKNFDSGSDRFTGLVEVENGKVKNINYIVRIPVKLRLSSTTNSLNYIWVTNYNHTSNKITTPVIIEYLWPRLEAYNEYKYWGRLNSETVQTMRFIYGENGYTFSRDTNIGSISIDGKTWTNPSTTWTIID